MSEQNEVTNEAQTVEAPAVKKMTLGQLRDAGYTLEQIKAEKDAGKLEIVPTTPRAPALPAFNGQTEARVTNFKTFITGRGHTMEDFKGDAGKLLRMAENAAYEAYKAQFNTVAAGALSMALASGEFTITKATKNKSGHITPVLVPVKKNAKQLSAIAYLESLGMKVVRPAAVQTIEHKS